MSARAKQRTTNPRPSMRPSLRPRLTPGDRSSTRPTDAPKRVVHAHADTLEEGQILASRYELEQTLGHGGMASVWAAWDRKLGQHVAVKVMHAKTGDLDAHALRFRREAALATQLRARAFPEVYDHGADGEHAYIAMELLEGETLLERLRRDGPISPEDALSLARGIASGLRIAHALQIVHRDLKPSNIFFARTTPKSSGVQAIVREGDKVTNAHDSAPTEIVKLLDFGIAKDTWDHARLTRPNILLGSSYYMSPEQIVSHRDVDPRSDLWSLGVVLFVSMTGKRPFSGAASEALAAIVRDQAPPPSSLCPHLPASLDAFFARVFQKEPPKRYQTVDDMVDALGRALEGRASETPARAALASFESLDITFSEPPPPSEPSGTSTRPTRPTVRPAADLVPTVAPPPRLSMDVRAMAAVPPTAPPVAQRRSLLSVWLMAFVFLAAIGAGALAAYLTR